MFCMRLHHMGSQEGRKKKEVCVPIQGTACPEIIYIRKARVIYISLCLFWPFVFCFCLKASNWQLMGSAQDLPQQFLG